MSSSQRRRCAGCGAPPSSRWRASISTTRSRSFTAPPSSRRASAEVWHAIGRVNALKFDGEAMWPAMEKAIELTEGTEALAELYAELTFESTMRGGMWKRPLEHGLVESWLARALELADAGGAAQARALVAKSTWEDDAELAEQAVALAERLDDPVLLSYAYWARSGAAFVGARLPRGRPLGATSLRAPRSPDRSGQDRPHPLLRSDGRARRRPAGRGRDARAQARHRRLRLSAHHEVHALGVLLFVEEALGHWDEVRRLQHRSRASRRPQPGRAVRAQSEDAVLVCRRVRRARPRRRGAATRGGCGRAGLSGRRHGLLARPTADASRTAARRPRAGRRATRVVRRDVAAGRMDGSLYALATKLEALIALGRTSEAEEAATSPSSARDVSRAVRATHARSRAQRPHLDRTGDRALRGRWGSAGTRRRHARSRRCRSGVALSGCSWPHCGTDRHMDQCTPCLPRRCATLIDGLGAIRQLIWVQRSQLSRRSFWPYPEVMPQRCGYVPTL